MLDILRQENILIKIKSMKKGSDKHIHVVRAAVLDPKKSSMGVKVCTTGFTQQFFNLVHHSDILDCSPSLNNLMAKLLYIHYKL